MDTMSKQAFNLHCLRRDPMYTLSYIIIIICAPAMCLVYCMFHLWSLILTLFSVLLLSPPPLIFLTLAHTPTMIGIPIGFDPVSYSRGEGDGFVDLTFRKFSNPSALTDNITVVFSTSDGSATGLFTKLPLALCPRAYCCNTE